jgi:tetratricopeptide (TPR) repeat protein
VRAEDVLDLLGRLVGQSLVVTEALGDGRARYRLLEPVRQYARRLLDERGEAEQVGGWHADFYLRLAECAEPDLFGPRMVECLERLAVEHDNLRAAVAWALAHGRAELAARLTHALARFFWQRGHREVLQWMEDALTSADQMSPGARARATHVVQLMRYRLGGAEGITAACQDAAATLCAEGKLVAGATDALMVGGMAALRTGDTEQAARLLQESLDLSESAEDEQGAALALAFLGAIPLSQGDYEEAEEYCKRGLALARRSGNPLSMYPPLYNLALAAQGKGEYARAGGLYVELLGVAEQMQDRPLVAFVLVGLAECLAAQGEPERAARLYGAADAVFASVGLSFHPLRASAAFHERYLSLAREQLGDEAFQAARTEGRTLSFEHALECARATTFSASAQ